MHFLKRLPAGEVEDDPILTAGGAQVLGAQADHGIGALLEIAGADIEVDDRVMGILIGFLPAVEEKNRRATGEKREPAQPLAETAGGGFDAAVTLRRRDALLQGVGRSFSRLEEDRQKQCSEGQGAVAFSHTGRG